MFHCSYLYLRFVYYGIAATTLGLLLVSTQAQTQQNPTRPSPGPFSSYANYSPSLATVFIVLISLFCIVGFLSIYLRHCSHFFGIPSPATSRLEAARGIHASVLESFPTFLYSDVKSHRLGTPHALECAVCLSEFEDNEILQMLPGCCHVFHPTCIQPWLFSHVTCPVCRADLRYDSYQLKPPPPPAPPPYDWITRQQSETDQSEPSNNHHHDNNITLYMGTQSPEITRKNQDRTRGKLPRSHSTGHSLAEDCDRFTLRLPIDIRNKLVNSTVVLPIAGSPRIGYREMARSVGCTGGKQFEPDRPWRFSVSPPFICRTGLGMSPAKSDGGTEYPGEGSSRRRLIEIDGVTQSSLVLKR